MARLSQYLIGQMANPGNGMLGQGIRSGMQGIGDAYAEKRKRAGMEAITRMLTQGDPNNPNVVQSVIDVGAQMNLDPEQMLQMVNQQQAVQQRKEAAARGVEEAKRAAERHAWQKSQYQYQQKLQREEKVQNKYTDSVLQAMQGDPEKAEAALEGVPPQYRGLAREAVAKRTQYLANKEALVESRKKRQPISDATLEAMKKTPGMEDAIAMYEADPNSPNAKGILEYAYSNAHKASLYDRSDADVSKWEYEVALEALTGANDEAAPWWSTSLFDGSPIAEEQLPLVAMEIAKAAKADPNKPLSELVKEAVRMFKKEKDEETPPDPNQPAGSNKVVDFNDL